VIDLHFVAPGLAVGARFPIEAAARLARDHGITRVVDVRVEACDDAAVLGTHGIELLHLPTEDTHAISQEMLRAGVDFVCAALDAGERVFIHCQHGIGRSALLALCVLVARGDSPLQALARTKDARPVVSPTPEQLRAFTAFATWLRDARGASWEVPGLEDLAAIAYRHLREDFSREEERSASTRAG
jgi:predicted protein tyrosine phosphatase